jgi:hypothetical protein
MIDGVSAGRDDGVCSRAGSQHPRAGLQAWRSHWMLVEQMEFHHLDWTLQKPGLPVLLDWNAIVKMFFTCTRLPLGMPAIT